MPLYALPRNITGPVGLLQYNHSIYGDLFGFFILLSLGFILFMSFKERFEFITSMTATIVVCNLVAFLLSSLGILNDMYFKGLLVLSGLVLILLWSRE